MLAGMRDGCLPGFAKSFVDVLAEVAGLTADQLPPLPPDDAALVAGKHVIDAVSALTTNRRERMRSLETTVTPWSAVRYFSTEEDADDVSVMVMRGAGLDTTALADMLVGMLPDAARAHCEALVTARQVRPYGIDLVDEDHADRAGRCDRRAPATSSVYDR